MSKNTLYSETHFRMNESSKEENSPALANGCHIRHLINDPIIDINQCLWYSP